MRNIDIPGAKEIFAKQDELLVTFWMNNGWAKAINILHDEIKKDFVEEKMKKLRQTQGKTYTDEERAEFAHQRMLDDFAIWGCE